jgi:hypothetical protein
MERNLDRTSIQPVGKEGKRKIGTVISTKIYIECRIITSPRPLFHQDSEATSGSHRWQVPNSVKKFQKEEVVHFVVGFNKSELEWRLSKASVQNLHLLINYGVINFTCLRPVGFAEYVDIRIDCNTALASRRYFGSF